jgi:hypothetical protein
MTLSPQNKTKNNKKLAEVDSVTPHSLLQLLFTASLDCTYRPPVRDGAGQCQFV